MIVTPARRRPGRIRPGGHPRRRRDAARGRSSDPEPPADPGARPRLPAPARRRTRLAGQRGRVLAGASRRGRRAGRGGLAALEPQPGDAVLDLYCGAGPVRGRAGRGGRAGRDGDRRRGRPGRGPGRPAQPAARWPWARVHKGDVAAASCARPGSGSRDQPGAGARCRAVRSRPAALRAGPRGHRLPRRAGHGAAGSPTCPATRPRWPATSALLVGARLGARRPARVRRVPDDPSRRVRRHPDRAILRPTESSGRPPVRRTLDPGLQLRPTRAGSRPASRFALEAGAQQEPQP